MSVHELKTDSDVFEAVWTGRKTCEIRYNDRSYTEGDLLVLKETVHTGEEMKTDNSRNYRGLPPIEGKPLLYTGREVMAQVTHVLTGYGIKEGWAVLSIKVYNHEETEPDH